MKLPSYCFFAILIAIILTPVYAEEPDLLQENIVKKENKQYLPSHDLDQKLKGLKPHDESSVEIDDNWINGEYATGQWGGLRTKLEEKGINFEVTYYSEPFFKTHGGLNNHSKLKYLGLVDYSLTLDTEKLGLWKGGTLFVLGQNVHGHALSEQQIGDIQTISSIDAPNLTQLAEYWYEHEFIPDRLKVKIGKQDANADFAIFDVCESYINSSFTLNPTIPMPTYPEPTLGAALFARPYKGLILRAGIFDGKENNGQFGFKSAFDNPGGSFIVAEPAIEHFYKNYPGKYIFGFWYHTGNLEEISHIHRRKLFSSHHGFYTGFSQMVFKENKIEDDTQGLTLHAQFGWAPSNRSEISRQYTAGLAYQGLIPHRNDDIAGIGFALADLSDRFIKIDGRTAETALELFYKFQVTPFLSIQPDLQYIFNPDGNLKNSLAIGVRTILTF
jgi:porin